MKNANKRILSQAGLLLTAFIWGGGFIVVKSSLDSFSPLWLLAARFAVAALAAPLLFYRRIRHIDKTVLKTGAVSGALIYLGFVLQTVGVRYTTASKNALLTSVYVVLVPFVYWLMIRKRPKPLQIVSALLCFCGIFLLLYNGDFGQFNGGDLLTLACGAVFAVQISYLGLHSKKMDSFALTMVQIWACAAASIICALIFEPGTFPSVIHADMVLSVFYLGFLSTLLAYFIQTAAQKYTHPSGASLILSLECAIGAVLSVLIFRDAFTPMMWAGGALTFGAVVMAQLKNSDAGGEFALPQPAAREVRDDA